MRNSTGETQADIVWTLPEAEEYLNNTAPQGKSVYGLGRINHLLDLLEHPETSFHSVTIAGTNGKGSVLAFLDAILGVHGIKTVCHVKPHLESITERIRIGGRDSTPEEFALALWEVRTAVEAGWERDDRPTYFELIFAAALCAGRTARADVGLLEAGLGGRLDAANGVDAEVLVLTSVGLDHTELLGDTLESITKEKLALARPGRILVCQANPPEVMQTVREYCRESSIRLFEVTGDPGNAEGFVDAKLGLRGPFQHANASLAVLAARTIAREGLPGLFPGGLDNASIRKGLSGARLPGRWEVINTGAGLPKVILDGAHNPSALARVLREFASLASSHRTIVFGLKASKPAAEIVPFLLDAADHIVFVPVPEVDCHAPDELARFARQELDKRRVSSQIEFGLADDIAEGVSLALSVTPKDGVILVTGSLYLVGAARSEIGKQSIREAPRGV